MVNDGLKCNHELDLEGTTLIKLSKRNMVSPSTIDCFCQCCKKCFRYTLSNGKYMLVK